MNHGECGVVMATFPDEAVASRVLDGLLDRRLAACVQTLHIQSAYRWKGSVHRDPEVLALIKTRISLYPEVEAYIRTTHPYETPEILLLPAATGLSDYLKWIHDETGPSVPDPSSLE